MGENSILDDLKQLYFLDMEIRQLEQELFETESKWRSVNLHGGFYASGSVSDPTGNMALAIIEYSGLIDKAVKELYEKKAKCEQYIQNLDDPVLRTVLRMRFIKFYSWIAIARKMGSRCEATPRMIVERFFNEK